MGETGPFEWEVRDAVEDEKLIQTNFVASLQRVKTKR